MPLAMVSSAAARAAAPAAPDSPIAPLSETTGTSQGPNTRANRLGFERIQPFRPVRRGEDRVDLFGARPPASSSAICIARAVPDGSTGHPFSSAREAVMPMPSELAVDACAPRRRGVGRLEQKQDAGFARARSRRDADRKAG